MASEFTYVGAPKDFFEEDCVVFEEVSQAGVWRGAIPRKFSESAAGFDLFSSEEFSIESGGRHLFSTGVKIVKFPHNCYGRISNRSSLSLKNGIQVGAGVVDPDYSGEIFVLLFNHSGSVFKVEVGDRIAQLVFERFHSPLVFKVDRSNGCEKRIFIEMNNFSSGRGDKGFGSSGV
jgi:dUTP pyrophosphatase